MFYLLIFDFNNYQILLKKGENISLKILLLKIVAEVLHLNSLRCGALYFV